MSQRIDPKEIAPIIGTLYPEPFDAPCRARERRKLGDVAGLSQFGVNLVRLSPETWSSQCHWHTESDEFVYILEGEVQLVTQNGEETLRAGDAAGFKAGDDRGHCLRNVSARDAVYLEIGTRVPSDTAHYPGLDLKAVVDERGPRFTHADGTPYPARAKRQT